MNGGGSSLRSALSYCVQQVRNYDYHHYLCLLELPTEMRKAAFALRAFNVETARAMDVASDPKIGLMRLLWWQEAIDKLYTKKPINHPAAQALSWAISEHNISKPWLKRSVEARIRDAQREVDDIPESIEELEKYAEDTVSTLLYNTLQAGGISSTTADHAASHIDLAEKHGLLVKQGGRLEILLDNNSREGLSNVVFEIASVANAHLLKARELAGKVPAEAKPVLLHSVPVQVLLDSLNKVQFDVFDPRIQRGVLGVPPLLFQFKLKWYSWRAMF
ncbi:NADH dehydrogenase (ubiquinone) complex I, assembly factor 6 isoform X2 [Arabidopsis lyrata subsp. lyrata]|uniref:NADH dehydrogenase (ubiquinone) complex I, assembly factor 6 isoform X2 n=1 Tax=Arabidopsis lyrata subsp. lyrata TaxID=81972 RepID=UPI000A29BA93|nr:NADH dehydrogenase (ubiquinone) complex I, assembly factor 6 isoform X2 [Arabidopsis lyrata subsp. lyrata]|eukprot:XP_020890778.1 NADH dehydrogenase (ubiquinone) complex I, assembly factor 6 isoform X2 [Arabidopsis lyrata subsp. lyrata]